MPSIMSWHGATAGRTSSRTMPVAGRLVACLERAVRMVAVCLRPLDQRPPPGPQNASPQPRQLGMQLFLSSYANGWARRHRHCGHLLQGRYRTELVEDKTYLWVLTRYVHLNPDRAGLAATPEAWISSSCPGYFRRRDRLDWVAYAWRSTIPGPPAQSSCRSSASPAPRASLTCRRDSLLCSRPNRTRGEISWH